MALVLAFFEAYNNNNNTNDLSRKIIYIII